MDFFFHLLMSTLSQMTCLTITNVNVLVRNAKLGTLTLDILFDYDFKKGKKVVFKIQCALEILDKRNQQMKL